MDNIQNLKMDLFSDLPGEIQTKIISLLVTRSHGNISELIKLEEERLSTFRTIKASHQNKFSLSKYEDDEDINEYCRNRDYDSSPSEEDQLDRNTLLKKSRPISKKGFYLKRNPGDSLNPYLITSPKENCTIKSIFAYNTLHDISSIEIEKNIRIKTVLLPLLHFSRVCKRWRSTIFYGTCTEIYWKIMNDILHGEKIIYPWHQEEWQLFNKSNLNPSSKKDVSILNYAGKCFSLVDTSGDGSNYVIKSLSLEQNEEQNESNTTEQHSKIKEETKKEIDPSVKKQNRFNVIQKIMCFIYIPMRILTEPSIKNIDAIKNEKLLIFQKRSKFLSLLKTRMILNIKSQWNSDVLPYNHNIRSENYHVFYELISDVKRDYIPNEFNVHEFVKFVLIDPTIRDIEFVQSQEHLLKQNLEHLTKVSKNHGEISLNFEDYISKTTILKYGQPLEERLIPETSQTGFIAQTNSFHEVDEYFKYLKNYLNDALPFCKILKAHLNFDSTVDINKMKTLKRKRSQSDVNGEKKEKKYRSNNSEQ